MTLESNINHYPVLDAGHVALIESWGSDERIIEAARMSTGKGFQGWNRECPHCYGHGFIINESESLSVPQYVSQPCEPCRGTGHVEGDRKLLRYLYTHKHLSPFEMAGAVFDIKAPIFVMREWHRHRTQSYNEMSARYIPLPDESYVPSLERIQHQASANKQAQGSKPVTNTDAHIFRQRLQSHYSLAEADYQASLDAGVPKELARLLLPVGRYSRMRASANLRNWLQFLKLRLDEGAQWEIRQYAQVVCMLLAEKFPQTMELFNNEQ